MLAYLLVFAMVITGMNLGSFGLAYAEEGAATLEAGDYYVYNVAAGKFLNGGNSWGTRASLVSSGQLMTLEKDESVYKLDSHISNGGEKHYLTNENFLDGLAAKLTIEPTESGSYTIATEIETDISILQKA